MKYLKVYKSQGCNYYGIDYNTQKREYDKKLTPTPGVNEKSYSPPEKRMSKTLNSQQKKNYPLYYQSRNMKMDLHNYKRRLEGQIKLVENAVEISCENKKEILEFKDYLLSEGIGAAKIARYLGDARKYCLMLKKSVRMAKEADIRHAVGMIEQSSLAAETKKGFKIMLRKFYRFLRGIKNKGEYPPEVSWISLMITKSNEKLPDELISEAEARLMIRTTDSLRNKALISVLADSGARVSEIGTMRIKHVSFETHGARLTIHGKTGTRKILVVYSSPYIKQWINAHPQNNNSDACLWPNSEGNLISYAMIAKILKQAAQRAGINKRIHPHLLRHSRATQLALVMSEAALKQYMGWAQSSKMAAIYIHMSGKDTDEAILRANGIEVEKKPLESTLKSAVCQRCGTINEMTNRFCKSCSLSLQADEAQMTITNDAKQMQASDIMNALLKDPEVLQLLTKKLNPVTV